jgi:kynureninase
MLVSFYRPTQTRNKILIEGKAFPSDHYALQSQIKFHGYDPKTSLVEINPRDGEAIIRTEDIEDYIEHEGDSIALVMFSGVNYYSGQAFEMERITKAGHKKGCIVGFDLAHAAGNLVMNLHDWGVDFAVCFVHEKHVKDNTIPKFLGWWGQDKRTRFLMEHEFKPIPTVESWQLSNPPIFQLASLRASLDIFKEAGMKVLREKSEKLTGYLEYLIEKKSGRSIEIITPKDKNQRGCQLSIRAKHEGKKLHQKLVSKGVVCDWREPDVIRVAPVPLYNAFMDVFNFAEILFG